MTPVTVANTTTPCPVPAPYFSLGDGDPWSSIVEARARHDLTATLIERLASGRIAPTPAVLDALRQLHTTEGHHTALAFRSMRQMVKAFAALAAGR